MEKQTDLKMMAMKISIVGTGYVGLCTGVGFALLGHKVICVDRDPKKIENINNGISPIYEDGLEQALKETKNNFKATTHLGFAVQSSDIIFIAVGTPSKKDGSIDLSQIEEVSKQIGECLADEREYKVIAVKSTVLPETTEKTVIPLIERYSGKRAGKHFGVCMNPEFLREGAALDDFLNPDRIVIGGLDKKSGDELELLYRKIRAPKLRTSLRTAEMIKYASNAFLATKISFINEIGNMCKLLGIDVYDVAEGMGLDKRIGKYFLSAGCGFGGSCFGKDVSALISKSRQLGHEPKIMKAVIDTNTNQPLILHKMLKSRLGKLEGKKIAVLGLAFKPGTDDIRDSPSIKLIEALLKDKSVVQAYDPRANMNMEKIFPEIKYFNNYKDAIKNADACVIVTDWDEFKNITKKDIKQMKNSIIIEGRKILDSAIKKDGICW
jgi:UDPglucose 6-dehydrogenase